MQAQVMIYQGEPMVTFKLRAGPAVLRVYNVLDFILNLNYTSAKARRVGTFGSFTGDVEPRIIQDSFSMVPDHLFEGLIGRETGHIAKVGIRVEQIVNRGSFDPSKSGDLFLEEFGAMMQHPGWAHVMPGLEFRVDRHREDGRVMMKEQFMEAIWPTPKRSNKFEGSTAKIVRMKHSVGEDFNGITLPLRANMLMETSTLSRVRDAANPKPGDRHPITGSFRFFDQHQDFIVDHPFLSPRTWVSAEDTANEINRVMQSAFPFVASVGGLTELRFDTVPPSSEPNE